MISVPCLQPNKITMSVLIKLIGEGSGGCDVVWIDYQTQHNPRLPPSSPFSFMNMYCADYLKIKKRERSPLETLEVLCLTPEGNMARVETLSFFGDADCKNAEVSCTTLHDSVSVLHLIAEVYRHSIQIYGHIGKGVRHSTSHKSTFHLLLIASYARSVT